ncbi:MAG: nuclear transport factor 2 family protein [Acidobacteriota bacterium]|nr:nuclear transport factor 2 family protein [Acidobacteriota bacterium]
MKKIFIKTIFTVALSLAAQTAFAQKDAAEQLSIGKPVVRQLKGTDAPQSFSIDLQKGQFLNLTVEQRGVDVVLKLYAPDNQLIGEYDSPNGTQGIEPLQETAATSGRYRLEVRPFTTETPMAGSYEVKILQIRAATAAEMEVLNLDRQFLTAWAKHDAASFEPLLAEDFSYTSYSATTGGGMNRAAFLADMKQRAATGSENINVKPIALRLHDYGDTAVVTGRSEGNYAYQNKPIEFRYGFTRTYVRRNNRWQLVAAQNTGIQQPAAPVAADLKSYDAYVGDYQMSNDQKTKWGVVKEGDKLMLTMSGQAADGTAQSAKIELMPESPMEFSCKSLSARAFFIRDEGGKVVQMTLVPYISSGTVAELKKLPAAK